MADFISGQHYQVIERLRSNGTFNGDLFRQLVLDGVPFTDASLQHCQIERCGMGGALFQRSRLDDVRISNTSFRQANAPSSAWVDTRMRLCDMAGMSFHRAILNGCRFDETLLSGADFSEATLTGCEFDLCDMMSTTFNGALLMRSRFRDARLGNANLMYCSFEGAQLVDMDLREVNLQSANLKNALLVRVHLGGANLEGVDLDGTTFVEVQGLPEAVLERQRRERAYRPRSSEAPLARMVDVQLEDAIEAVSPYQTSRLAREILRTYVVEGAGALLSEDRVAALLRQRNLSFSDLMRFIKERFAHDEFNQFVVEGENVYVRTNAGDVPLTRYRAPGAAAQEPAPSRGGGMGGGMGGGTSNAGMTGGSSSPAGGMGGSSPAPARPPAQTPPASPPANRPQAPGSAFGSPAGARSTVSEQPRSAPMPPQDVSSPDDAFEPDRFGMIDI